MVRIAIALTLVTAGLLGAQSQQPKAQRLSQADSAAILGAARAEVARLAKLPPGQAPASDESAAAILQRRDSAFTRAPDVIEPRADTAWVTVWASEDRFVRKGQKVRVERREGQWVAIHLSTNYFVEVRYSNPET